MVTLRKNVEIAGKGRVSAAPGKFGLPRRAGMRESLCASESGEILRVDRSDIGAKLQRVLAWYGLPSVKVARLRTLNDTTAAVDLFDEWGNTVFVFRIEVDRLSGAFRPRAAQLIGRLLDSRRTTASPRRGGGGFAQCTEVL